MAIKSYKDLEVWQVAMALVENCYKLTANFPREESFGLTSQIRRAAVSVPSNIAEGFGRETTGSFVQFLRVAQGSTRELETQLMIAERVGLASGSTVEGPLSECARVGKMLWSLIRRLQEKTR